MLNAAPVHNRSALPRPISATAAQIPVEAGRGAMFDPGPGNHYYLTIRQDGMVERVRVTGRSGDLLQVQRGVDGTVARNWNQNACLTVEWNPAMLCEFIQQCMNGGPTPSGVTAGTYCLSQCHCVTVGADGRITAIEGGTGC